MSEELTAIMGWDRNTLLERWQAVFGLEPPNHTHASFMRLALAWQHQAESKTGATGKLPGLASGTSRRSGAILRPGTRLIREWQGTTYQVLVTEKGFDFEGRHYRSLSAIARAITGTPWSGPAFFGIGK